MVEILYRDSDIVVCVKPAGIVSQDAGEGSMPQLLREQLQCEYVAVVHRLDREVGGVMVYALSKRAAAALSTAVQNHGKAVSSGSVRNRTAGFRCAGRFAVP